MIFCFNLMIVVGFLYPKPFANHLTCTFELPFDLGNIVNPNKTKQIEDIC